jgi:hypothetical protein
MSESQGGDALSLFNEGVRLQQQGDIEQAKRLYRFALKVDPNFEPAQTNLRYLSAGTLTLTRPRFYEVVQRQAEPARPHATALFEPPHVGSGEVEISGRFGDYREAVLEVVVTRVGRRAGAVARFEGIRLTLEDGAFTTRLSLPAGGWYVLALVITAPDGTRAETRAGPVGVGEVYVIAGQSFAASTSDALLTIDDEEGRVVAFHPNARFWRIAHDPQPGANRDAADEAGFWKDKAEWARQYGITGAGGSPWPAAMNLLLAVIDMPIGMINVAESGTPLAAWRPGQPFYERLLRATREVKRCRAILWAQGESDVMNGNPPHSYVAGFRELRDSLAANLGWRPDWLVAKSTHHPLVYDKPEEERALRAALEAVWREPGVFAGPDTDLLRGPGNRSSWQLGVHFTRSGQLAAGALWFSALLQHLQACGTET